MKTLSIDKKEENKKWEISLHTSLPVLYICITDNQFLEEMFCQIAFHDFKDVIVTVYDITINRYWY